MARIAIAGAGIAGLTTALTLLQQVREQSSAHVVVISLKPGTSAGTVQVVAEMERQP